MRIYLLATLLFAAIFSFGQPPTCDDCCEYTIPVVVHIMNPEKGSDLVSPIHVQYAIDYLNLVFAGKYPGMDTAEGTARDVGIRFELAKQDEKGNPTNGIDIVNASGLRDYPENGVAYKSKGQVEKGCDELALKQFAYWDRKHYLNIWVVNKINGKDGGIWSSFKDAYHPENGKLIIAAGTIPDLFSQDSLSNTYIEKDGLLVLSYLFKGGFNERKSDLVHEIGHYLNLFHVFQGDEKYDNVTKKVIPGVCPDSDTAKGDKVADTDPVTRYISDEERIGHDNPCKPGKKFTKNTEHNFMSYNPNKYLNLFTNGQKKRMRDCLNDPNLRKELIRTFKETSDDNSEENNLKCFGNNMVFRNGKKLVLQLKSVKKNIVLTSNLTDNGDGVDYIFIGYSNDLNSFIVENVGYESSDFSFINRNNGAETRVPSINFKILPSKKWVIFYNSEGDENGNAFSFTEDGLNSLL